MATAAENERLATLETKVSQIENDVKDIKMDVKALVLDAAARRAREEARRSTGVWTRFLAERAIAILALMVSILVFFADRP